MAADNASRYSTENGQPAESNSKCGHLFPFSPYLLSTRTNRTISGYRTEFLGYSSYMKLGFVSLFATICVSSALVFGVTDGVAAYPPGTALQVTVTPNPATVGDHVTALATNVQAGCNVIFTFWQRSVTVSSSGGSASADFQVPNSAGHATMHAKTANCAAIEHSSTNVVVTGRPRVVAPARVCSKKTFVVKVSNFKPRTRVSVRMTQAAGTGSVRSVSRALAQSRSTGSTGKVSMAFNIASPGTYLVAAVGPSQRATTSVRIVRC